MKKAGSAPILPGLSSPKLSSSGTTTPKKVKTVSTTKEKEKEAAPKKTKTATTTATKKTTTGTFLELVGIILIYKKAQKLRAQLKRLLRRLQRQRK